MQFVTSSEYNVWVLQVSLRLDADEAERVLGDRQLLAQVLADTQSLGRLAKKT